MLIRNSHVLVVAVMLLAIGLLSHGANGQVTAAPPIPVAPVLVAPISPIPVVPVLVAPVSPIPVAPLSVAVAPDSGSGGGGGNPPEPATLYVTVMCAFAQDGSDECQQGVTEATSAITNSMAEEAAASVSRRMLTVHFTAGMMDRVEQIKFLKEIEDNAIATMELRLNHQLKALSRWPQPLPRAVALAAIAKDERALDQINQEARKEADTGQNWSQSPQRPTSTYTYESSVYNKAESWHMSPALKHEFDCAGAGNKAGCNWDGRKNSSLYTKQ